MKVKDFMAVMEKADDQSVVVMTNKEDFDEAAQSELSSAENRYGWVAENFPQYREAEIESVRYQRYDEYHSTLVILVKAA